MAGKKGRSGRKPKNKQVQPVQSAAPAKNNSVQQTTGDPFAQIEREMTGTLPPLNPPQEAGAAPAAGQEPEKLKAPVEILGFLTRRIYDAETAACALAIGLKIEEKAALLDPQLIEDQIPPLCRVVEKHFPPEWLQALNENSPEILLGIAFFEAQANLFINISKIKKELQAERQAQPEQPQQQKPPAAPPPPQPPAGGNFSYPKIGEV